MATDQVAFAEAEATEVLDSAVAMLEGEVTQDVGHGWDGWDGRGGDLRTSKNGIKNWGINLILGDQHGSTRFFGDQLEFCKFQELGNGEVDEEPLDVGVFFAETP